MSSRLNSSRQANLFLTPLPVDGQSLVYPTWLKEATDAASLLFTDFAPDGLIVYGVVATTAQYNAGIANGTYLMPPVFQNTIPFPVAPPAVTTLAIATVKAQNEEIIQANLKHAAYAKDLATFKGLLIESFDLTTKTALQGLDITVGIARMTTQAIHDYLSTQLGHIAITEAMYCVDKARVQLVTDDQIVSWITNIKKYTQLLAQQGQVRAYVDAYYDLKVASKTSVTVTKLLIDWEKDNQDMSILNIDMVWKYILDNMTKTSIAITQNDAIQAAVAQALAAERIAQASVTPAIAAASEGAMPAAPQSRGNNQAGRGNVNARNRNQNANRPRQAVPKPVADEHYCWYHGTKGHKGTDCTFMQKEPFTAAHRNATHQCEINGKMGHA